MSVQFAENINGKTTIVYYCFFFKMRPVLGEHRHQLVQQARPNYGRRLMQEKHPEVVEFTQVGDASICYVLSWVSMGPIP